MDQDMNTLSPQLAERVRQLSDETLVIALEAFREGRRAGESRLGAELAEFLEQVFRELETTFGEVADGDVPRFEQGYEGAHPSPVVAAHFGGAGDVLVRVRGRLDKLTKRGK